MRNLVPVLCDQLDHAASAFEGFDPRVDAVWMAEVAEESTHVWSSKPRVGLFLGAMRHVAKELAALGRAVHYRCLDDRDRADSLSETLTRSRRTPRRSAKPRCRQRGRREGRRVEGQLPRPSGASG